MTKYFCIFTILSFLGTQAMALNCGLSCAASEAVAEDSKASHDCCPSNEKDEKDSSKCMGEVYGICFHEFSLVKASEVQSVSHDFVLNTDQFILADLSKRLAISDRAPQDILDYHDHFLIYRSQTSLYLLKDQLLI